MSSAGRYTEKTIFVTLIMNIIITYLEPALHPALAAKNSKASELKKKQTRHRALQHRLQQASIMLALLVAVLVNVCRGQSFTPVEYKFQNLPGSIPHAGSVLDQTHFISSASCGYGTWTVTTDGRWFLLSDTLSATSTSSTAPVASGVVESGILSVLNDPILTETKVVANLAGNVRFVSPNQNRDGFVIQGFNDERATNPLYKNIDISFAGLPNTSLSRNIVKQSIVTYPTASLMIGASYYQLIRSIELDWRDVFDVAIDSEFLYISYIAQTDPGVSWANLDWCTITVKLSDGLMPTTLTPSPTKHNDDYVRPTIACNVRNSGTPQYFAAALFQVVSGLTFTYTVQTIEVIGNNPTSWGGIPLNYVDPATTNPINPTHLPFVRPTHLRAIVTSSIGVKNQNSSKKALYILGGGADDAQSGLFSTAVDNLVLHVKGEPFLRYIDGVHIGNHDLPMAGITAFQLVNQYMIGFANPYDGSNNALNDEIHCMYQLSDDRPNTPAYQRFPLMIIRGCNNGKLQMQPGAPVLPLVSTTDTRTIINKRRLTDVSPWLWLSSPKFVSESFAYLGSVNQMGIHTYWVAADFESSAEYTYYRRDYRNLDETIEESTLLTYDNTVSNGTSHGGTVGAKLLGGRTMTLWTDPNFGSTGLLYKSLSTQIRWQNARLNFKGDGVRLDIGETQVPVCLAGGDGPPIPCRTTWAKFVMLPNTEVLFEDLCERDHNQVLAINPGSTFDFYGIPSNTGLSNIFGAGTIHLLGQGNVAPLHEGQSYLPDISAPSHLNIYAGATFVVPNSCFLIANKAIIDCKFDKNIFPINISNNNPYETGKLEHRGTAELTGSYVKGHHNTTDAPPGMAVTTIVKVLPPLAAGLTTFIPPSCSLGFQQWLSDDVEYSNTPNTGANVGRSNFIANGTTNTSGEEYRDISITGGFVKDVEIEIQNPVHNLEIVSNVFTKMQNKAVNIVRTLTRSYSGIDVLNNTMTFANPEVSGINIEGFDTRRTPTFDLVFVDNNTLTSTASAPTGTPFGIQIKNTDAKVTNNEITGAGFFNGIVVDGVSMPSTEGTTTFLCTNTISDCTGNGIFSNRWKGYGFLNIVLACGVGHRIEGDDKRPHIHFSTYENCEGAGIFVNANTRAILSHLDDGTYDIGGHNIIKHNNQSASSGQLVIDPARAGRIDIDADHAGENSGDNNIIANANDGSDFLGFSGPGSAGSIMFAFGDNYWAAGTGNGSVETITSGDPMFSNIGHSVPPSGQPSSLISKPSFECGAGFVPAIPHHSQNQQWLTSEECGKLETKGDGYSGSSQYQKAYDTLRYYVEQCAKEKWSWQIFGTISSNAAALCDNSKITIESYREWLKSVLYLNPDSLYYCSDAIQIAATYDFQDSVGGIDGNAGVTVLKYLIDSANCSIFHDGINDLWRNQLRYWQIRHWRDTVTDSLKTPLDTGYTTIDELGLQILRGPTNSVIPDIYTPLNKRPIVEARAIPNPMKDEVELWYKLTEGALVKIEVYDALGKQMYSLAQGYKPEGENRLHLDTRSWSSGSYYARFTTLGGEVKTLKLIKE